MKKIFLLFVIFLTFLCLVKKADAASLYKTFKSDKPFALLIYTNWSDYTDIYECMKQVQPQFTNYNFVKVNLAEAEAMGLFNGYIVIKRLPMVVIGKQGGKLNQLIDNTCAADASCLSKRLSRFER